jgi:hypothetical protein
MDEQQIKCHECTKPATGVVDTVPGCDEHRLCWCGSPMHYQFESKHIECDVHGVRTPQEVIEP